MPEFLKGASRLLPLGWVAARAAWRAASRALGGQPRAAMREVHRLAVLARALDERRSVRFGRYIFFNSFSPPLGHPAFLAMLDSLASEPSRPFLSYAVFAITRRCMFRCEHCYAAGMLGSTDVLTREDLLAVTRHVLDAGVGLFSIEGGEPLLRADDVLAVLGVIGDRAAPSVATTGFPVTPALARALAAAGLVTAHVSLDHPDPDEHNRFRRSPRAFDRAVEAIGHFREAGVFPVLAVCPTRRMVEEGGLERILALARELGVGMIELLDPMPSGNYLGDPTTALGPDGIALLKRFQERVNGQPGHGADPVISARCHLEAEERFGCGWGGNAHMYVDARGHVQPCVYVALSAGNVLTEEFAAIYARMRAMFPRPLGVFCPAHALAADLAAELVAGRPLPTPPETSARLCRRFAACPLPGVLARLDGPRWEALPGDSTRGHPDAGR